MQDRWYSDNRDLAKWSILLALAKQQASHHILQVLYYRKCEWPDIEIDDKDLPIPEPVIKHFRDVHAISSLNAACVIEVLATPFRDRASYHSELLRRIDSRPNEPGVVFLDPDTGLQPSGRYSDQHVLESELNEIWGRLRTRDVLALYQHKTNRSGRPWVKPKKEQFERAIGLSAGTAKLASAKKIATDVVFFYASKAR